LAQFPRITGHTSAAVIGALILIVHVTVTGQNSTGSEYPQGKQFTQNRPIHDQPARPFGATWCKIEPLESNEFEQLIAAGNYHHGNNHSPGRPD
jgi:hypothetical protein